MATFLVTGGAGFIGSNLVRELLKRRYRVRVLDNFSTGLRENLTDILGEITLIEGSITQNDDCVKAAQGCDYVIHLAAQISVPGSFENPILNNQINLDGTLHMLKAAQLAKAKSLVFASSCAVYGNVTSMPITETTALQPLSPYAVTKLAGESYCSMYSDLGLLNTVIFRFFNVYGPRQNPYSQYSSVVPLFIDHVLKEKSPTIFGDGSQSRDFIFVGDLVTALIHGALHSEILKGQRYNLCSGKSTSINDLFRTITKLIGNNLSPQYAPARLGDILLSLGNGQAFERAAKKTGLDFSPSPLLEGLQTTLGWFKWTVPGQKVP